MAPRHLLAATARQLQPLAQGQLDALCGLYAVVNAVRITLDPVRRLHMGHARQLFGAGIDELVGTRRLSMVITEGMSASTLLRVSHRVADEAVHVVPARVMAIPLLPHPTEATKGQALAAIRAGIDAGRPVLATLMGRLNHTTVVVGASTTRLKLFDSYGFSAVVLDKLELLHPAATQRHQLDARTLLTFRLADP